MYTGRGGDTAHTFMIGGAIGVGKTYTGRGEDTAHTLLMGGNNWGGDTTQH